MSPADPDVDIQADFALVGFLAAQQAAYDTPAGRAALEAERHMPLAPTEVAWRRHLEAADRAVTRRVIDDLDARRLTRARMLAAIDDASRTRYRQETTP